MPRTSFGMKTTTASGAPKQPQNYGISQMNQTLASQPAPQMSTQTSAFQSPVQSYLPPQQATTASSTPPPAGKPGLFQNVGKSLNYSGLVGSLADVSKPSGTQTRIISDIEKTARQNAGIAENARALSEQYGKRIAEVGGLGAGAVAGNLSTGTNVVGSGNAAIASQSASARMSALSAAQQAALQGTGQQLTAQQQTAAAQQAALGGANTQQAQQMSGLGAAAGLAAPSTAPYGQTVFNPLTGQYGGGQGNLDPQTQAPSLAQRVLNGQMTYDQAIASMAYAGNAGRTFLDNAITQAGGNPLSLQASGAAQQSNIQQAGTAGTDIARSGLAQTTQDYVAMTSASQFAHDQARAVTDILDKTGLNNVSSTDYNKAVNNLKGRFSSTDFVALNAALREAQIAYTNLLSSAGGTPTGNEENAIATLNINQSSAAINSSIVQLENAVARRLQAVNAARQTYEQNLGGSQPQYGAPSGESGLYDF